MKILRGGEGKYLQMSYPAKLKEADSWSFFTEFTYNSNGYRNTFFSAESPYLYDYYYESSSYGNHVFKAPRLFIYDNRLQFQLSNTGTSWNIADIRGNYYFNWDTQYKLNAGFDGSKYYVQVSAYNDGSNPQLTTNGSIGGDNYACSGYYNYWEPYYAFRNYPLGNTPWRGYMYNGYNWLTYYTPTAIVATGFKLVNYRNGYNLKNGIFQGSNNNTDWDNLYTITDNSNANYHELKVDIDNTTAYKYYRLYITESYSRDYVEIQNLKIYGFDTPSWSDFVEDISIESTEKVECSRPFLFFNSPYSISNSYFSGPVNLSSTAFKLTKDSVDYYYFNGSTQQEDGFFNYYCAIDNYIASGFTNSNYIRLINKLYTNTNTQNYKIITRVFFTSNNTEQSIIWDKTNDSGLGLSNFGKLKLYGEGFSIFGTTKIETNTWYWLGLEWDGNDYRVYTMIDDERYTLGNLPQFPKVVYDALSGTYVLEDSEWNFEFRRKSSNNFFENILYIGYNPFNTNQFLRGMVDLKYTLIGNNVINYNVSANGYFTKYGNDTITTNTTKQITLEQKQNAPTFTINPTPADATVSLICRGYLQIGNSIIVPSGTDVVYTVSKEDYATVSGIKKVEQTEMLSIELAPETRLIPDLSGYNTSQYQQVAQDLGVYLSTWNTESNLIDSFQDTPENSSYPRWQTYGVPSYAQLYYPSKVMTMDRYTIKCRYELNSYRDRLMTGWRIWGLLTPTEVDLSNTNWQSNATLLATGSDFTDLPPNETMREFTVDSDKTAVQFNDIIFEVTNRNGGGSSYTTVGQIVFYGTKTSV